MSAHIGPIPLPAPGTADSGYFTFDDPLLGKYQWPYFAVAGRQPGLKFLLTAGIHAAEYTGTLAAVRLGRQLVSQAAQVNGTIVIIPLLNTPGFFERSVYVNPEDGQNLNRAFPGQADSTWSQRFAHHLLNDVVIHFDRAMDMHAGENETSTMLISRPDLVHLDRAGRESGADQARLALPGTLYTGIWWYARFPEHYSGDGSAATRELGEYDMQAWIAAIQKAIQAVKADKTSLQLQNEFFEKAKHPLDTPQ